jgi:hypothetical protein
MTKLTPTSKYLPLNSVTNLRNAALFAEAKGYVLNTFFTLNLKFIKPRPHTNPTSAKTTQSGWRAGDRSPEQINRFRNGLLRTLKDWCDRQGIPNAHVYALENTPRGGMGPHIHIQLHLPENSERFPNQYPERLNDLKSLLTKFIGYSTPALKQEISELQRKKASSANPTSMWLPFYISPSKQGANQPLNASEQLTKLRYIVGGVDPAALVNVGGVERFLDKHNRHGMDITLKDPGNPRVSKRAGVSRPIDRAARAEAHWDDSAGANMDWLSRRQAQLEQRQRVVSALERLVKGSPPVPPAPAPKKAAPNPVPAPRRMPQIARFEPDCACVCALGCPKEPIYTSELGDGRRSILLTGRYYAVISTTYRDSCLLLPHFSALSTLASGKDRGSSSGIPSIPDASKYCLAKQQNSIIVGQSLPGMMVDSASCEACPLLDYAGILPGSALKSEMMVAE